MSPESGPVLSQKVDPEAVAGAEELLTKEANPKAQELPMKTESPGTKLRGRPRGGEKGTFAGRRPSGDPTVWRARVDNYWKTREEVAADYPGKSLNWPSGNQMKYWDFIRDNMKDKCPQGCSKVQMLAGLAAASKKYKAKLLEEAEAADHEDSPC